MIDPFVAESPWVQSIVQKEAQKKKAEGKIEGMRQDIVAIVNLWYPQLLDLANPQIEKVVDTDELARLHVKLLSLGQRNQRKVEKLLQELSNPLLPADS